MASITTEGRNEVIALYTAMFNGAPGAANLSGAVAIIESGKKLIDVANELAKKADFSSVYPAFLTADEFAARLVSNMLGSEVSAGASTWATNWVKTQLAAGKTPAFVISTAVQSIRSTTNTDFANAKAMLANKVDVASYYSVVKEQSSTDLATLQAVITGVSSTSATVTTAKTTIDTGAALLLGKTYTLTTGIDTFTGGKGADIFNAVYNATLTADTLTGLDAVDGGDGEDTINVTDTTSITIPTSATVKNVELANITSGANIVSGDVSAWTGLTKVNAVSFGGAVVSAATTTDVSLTEGALAGTTVTLTGGKDVAVTALGATNVAAGLDVATVTGAAGTVTVNVTGDYTAGAALQMGDIVVTGGTKINITQNAGITAAEVTAAETATNNATVTLGGVSVTGTAATTNVTVSQTATANVDNDTSNSTAWAPDVNQIGVTAGTVTINDANAASATSASTIKDVNLSNYGAGSAINAGISTLTLGGTSGTLTINDNLTTPTITTLDLTVNKLTNTVSARPLATVSNTITDADNKFTSIAFHVKTAGFGNGSTISGIAATGVKSITVDGDNTLTITNSSGMSALETVTVSGAAGFTSSPTTAGVPVNGGLAVLKSIVSTSTGAINVRVDDTAVTVTGGAGADTVAYETAIGATAVINMGAGNDTLILGGATPAGASITGGDGKDVLRVVNGNNVSSNVTHNSFEVANLNGYTGNTLNMDNLASATELSISAALAANATIINATAGTNLFISNTAIFADGALNVGAFTLNYGLKTDTDTDAWTIDLKTTDLSSKTTVGKGDNSTNAINLAGAITANEIETLTVNATASNFDGSTGTTAKTGLDYVNTIASFAGSDLKTIVYTGNASLTITSLTAAALTKVDASAATGSLNITLGAGANSSAVAVIGGQAADTIVMTGNAAANNIIVGNNGADVITLAAAGTKETVRYASDTDSVLVLIDTTSPVDGVSDVAAGFDTITGFTAGEDKLELSTSLGLAAGDARSAITGKGIIADTAAALQTLIGTGANFFSDGATVRALASASTGVGGNLYVFVDTNADGSYTLGTDQTIKLVGTTSLLITDVVFG